MYVVQYHNTDINASGNLDAQCRFVLMHPMSGRVGSAHQITRRT